uniref:Uncharacterized protein n=1 Tax=Aegilops tauschii TaxID=37682 RepID=N1QSG3_AEGTA
MCNRCDALFDCNAKVGRQAVFQRLFLAILGGEHLIRVLVPVLMEAKGAGERDALIDLESGNSVVISEHGHGMDANFAVSPPRTPPNGGLNRVMHTKDDGNQHMDCSSPAMETASKNGDDRKSEGEEKLGLLDSSGGEKAKKKRSSSKKPPRPPRPPTHLPLDASDQKLLNELNELALLKRARIERMKALKKMKNGKQGSSNSNFCPMIITIIFCLVILWQATTRRTTGAGDPSRGGNGRGTSTSAGHDRRPCQGPRRHALPLAAILKAPPRQAGRCKSEALFSAPRGGLAVNEPSLACVARSPGFHAANQPVEWTSRRPWRHLGGKLSFINQKPLEAGYNKDRGGKFAVKIDRSLLALSCDTLIVAARVANTLINLDIKRDTSWVMRREKPQVATLIKQQRVFGKVLRSSFE